jgi:hypothetical protein
VLSVYYKDEVHEEKTMEILKKFEQTTIHQDVEYGAFAYIIGATYKAEYIIQCIDEDGNIDLDDLFEVMGFFSTSEQGMIRFALQCFNSSIDDIKLSEVMRPLDDENTKMIKQAIDIRY